MTPKPPPSSEGSSLPPRSRPNLGDFVKDSHELDLWSFDDPDAADRGPAKPPSRSASPDLPVPREARKKKQPAPDAAFPEKSKAAKNSVRVDVSVERQSAREAGRLPKSADTFDELDDWDGAGLVAPNPEIQPSPAVIPCLPAASEEPAVEQVVPEVTPPMMAEVDDLDEFSPVLRENATPVSLVPHLGLSKVERIGLYSLLGVLLVGGLLFFFSTIHRLPTGPGRAQAGDFPLKGRHVTILAADTFWRAPITEGQGSETFRRGTELLPVVDLTISGGPAGLRLFFRNEDGLVMGDAVTRSIQPGAPLQIAATAGFENVGMHAAYRTGHSKPWTVEVHEAPSATSPIADFKKLFEINISTDRR